MFTVTAPENGFRLATSPETVCQNFAHYLQEERKFLAVDLDEVAREVATSAAFMGVADRGHVVRTILARMQTVSARVIGTNVLGYKSVEIYGTHTTEICVPRGYDVSASVIEALELDKLGLCFTGQIEWLEPLHLDNNGLLARQSEKMEEARQARHALIPA